MCEAMLNGIPPIVSDHGALPEVLNNGGLCIATPRKLYDHSPVTSDEIAPWVFAIKRLIDSPTACEVASVTARMAGERYDSRNLTPVYCDFFERILAAEPGAPTTRPLVEPNQKEST